MSLIESRCAEPVIKRGRAKMYIGLENKEEETRTRILGHWSTFENPPSLNQARASGVRPPKLNPCAARRAVLQASRATLCRVGKSVARRTRPRGCTPEKRSPASTTAPAGRADAGARPSAPRYLRTHTELRGVWAHGRSTHILGIIANCN